MRRADVVVVVLTALFDVAVAAQVELPVQYRLANHVLANYQSRLIPKRFPNESIQVFFSMELYQLIEVNEPQQYVMVNAWIAERWIDGLLGWDPAQFGGLTELMVRHEDIWLPDTTLYNSLALSEDDSRRLLHAKLTTLGSAKGALVELLYPTIYKVSCLLNLRLFPFDVQHCKLTFGSWSFDSTLIDYYAKNASHGIGIINCLDNEGWNILATRVERLQNKYDCCPNNYTLLEFYLVIQRKPLYYIINLVTPTSIITLISIVGFFTSASINDLRQEKITLGITTLLSMSILVFMVSDKMPSTSSFIPLIGWFYTSMMLIISFGTLASSMVIYVQRKGILGKQPEQQTMRWAKAFATFVGMEMPLVMKEAYAKKAKEEKLRRQMLGLNNRKQSLWTKVYKMARDQSQLKKLKAEQPKLSIPTSLPVVVTPETPPRKCFSISDDVTYFQDDMENSANSGLLEPPEPKLDAKNRWKSLSASPLKRCDTSDASIESVIKPVEVMVSPFAVRNLAQLEWDWLAAVLERVFLISFLIVFVLSAIGINTMGFLYWSAAVDLHLSV